MDTKTLDFPLLQSHCKDSCCTLGSHFANEQDQRITFLLLPVHSTQYERGTVSRSSGSDLYRSFAKPTGPEKNDLVVTRRSCSHLRLCLDRLSNIAIWLPLDSALTKSVGSSLQRFRVSLPLLCQGLALNGNVMRINVTILFPPRRDVTHTWTQSHEGGLTLKRSSIQLNSTQLNLAKSVREACDLASPLYESAFATLPNRLSACPPDFYFRLCFLASHELLCTFPFRDNASFLSDEAVQQPSTQTLTHTHIQRQKRKKKKPNDGFPTT